MKIIYNLNVIIIAKFILFKFYGRMGDGDLGDLIQSPNLPGDWEMEIWEVWSPSSNTIECDQTSRISQ